MLGLVRVTSSPPGRGGAVLVAIGVGLPETVGTSSNDDAIVNVV
jgi:hypothetical protein